MLRVVKRTFEADYGRVLLPGDIVDVSTWKHHKSLKENGFIGDTDATRVTVDVTVPPEEEGRASTASASAKKAKSPAKKVKRSALASRPRVFARKA